MGQYLVKFKPVIPDQCFTQEETIDWLKSYLPSEYSRYVTKFSVSKDYISSRYIFSESGVGQIDRNDQMYSMSEKSQPQLSERSCVAQKLIENIFADVYRNETETIPNDLLHVSCTHYQSPSGAQLLVAGKEWNKHTNVTHMYHMGCYASLPAIRTARGLNASGSKKVDIVHTEICSFHIDKDDCSPEQIIMKTLFSDGAIRYSSLDESTFKEQGQAGFHVLQLHEEIVPNSSNEMTWKLSENCFLMTLSRKVPTILSESIRNYMHTLFEKAGFDFEKDKDKFHFAIHPGGPKIVELVQETINLSENQIKHSKYILNTRGNMSSATLPHIWDRILENENESDYVCSVAFGPGLTITGAIFQICRQ